MATPDQDWPGNEAMYRKIIETTPAIILVLAANGDMLDLNPGAERLYGCKKADVLGKNYYATFLPETERDAVRVNVRKVLAGKPSYGYENPVIAADGKERIVLWNVDRLLNEQGEPVAIVAAGQDITERKQAENGLRKRTAEAETSRRALLYMLEDLTQAQKAVTDANKALRKLSCCVEQSGEAILITDRQGNIEYVNPAFTRLTGYAAAEAIGRNPKILNSGNQDAAFYRDMWQTIAAGRSWQGKVIDKRKDGSFYPALLTISPIHDQSDNTLQFTHFVGIQSDLTRIDDAEERFQQAQKMEAIGTLVGGIAHDFNNMLAGMTGNLYLAKKRAQGMPEILHRLDTVEALSYRASEMIAQLLAFARKGTINMQAIPLTSYIKEVMKLLSVSVPENIRVEQHICSDDLQVKGDSTQIHQMLMNLVNNARDALDGIDKPMLTITLEPFEADETFVQQRNWHIHSRRFAHISVRDNGCGIPAHQIKHLFEPFFTTKEQGKGTGLGLAMVYGAVKSHQGFVEVESKAGKGATFHLYLPLVAARSETDQVHAEEPVKGNGECILLVDDEPHLLAAGRDLLTSLGYKVLTAVNGQEAVDTFKAKADSIDLVILDVVMPVMGGVVACQCMREIRANIKVIYSTGYDKDETISKELIGEHALILNKPTPVAEMSRMIRNKLDT